jgi:hypothetical protein
LGGRNHRVKINLREHFGSNEHRDYPAQYRKKRQDLLTTEIKFQIKSREGKCFDTL